MRSSHRLYAFSGLRATNRIATPAADHQQCGRRARACQLEDLLPQILQEVELCAAFADEQPLEAEFQRAQRQRRWEAAIEAAKQQLREAHRADILMRQADDWACAIGLDRYLDALEVTIDATPTAEERSAPQEWLDWARGYRHRLDPLNRPLAIPADPKPTADNLKPFLKGWSFYGPKRLIDPD